MNKFYSAQGLYYVFIYPSVKNLAFEANETVSPFNWMRTFVISYESLGEPSCAKFWMSSKTPGPSVTYGTSAQLCSSNFPSIPYAGPYEIADSKLIINATMSLSGFLSVNFEIKNAISSEKITTYITVSDTPCLKPILSIVNRSAEFFNPMKIMRSKLFTLVGETKLICSEEPKNEKRWYAYFINETTGSVIRAINMTDNPSIYNAELVIQDNSLSYGTYKFVYEVKMSGSVSVFQTSIDTYVKIVPSGMAIIGLENGVIEITRGVGQQIVFNPLLYSFDIDDLTPASTLSFKYYCRPVDEGIPKDFPSYSLGNLTDLRAYQLNASLKMSTNTTCFNSSSKFFQNVF